jgi:hypothetical protein
VRRLVYCHQTCRRLQDTHPLTFFAVDFQRPPTSESRTYSHQVRMAPNLGNAMAGTGFEFFHMVGGRWVRPFA